MNANCWDTLAATIPWRKFPNLVQYVQMHQFTRTVMKGSKSIRRPLLIPVGRHCDRQQVLERNSKGYCEGCFNVVHASSCGNKTLLPPYILRTSLLQYNIRTYRYFVLYGSGVANNRRPFQSKVAADCKSPPIVPVDARALFKWGSECDTSLRVVWLVTISIYPAEQSLH